MKYIAIISLIFLLTACSKKEDQPDSPDGHSTIIADLVGDTSALMSEGDPFTTLYFSFTTGSAVSVSEADKTTTKWDLAFTGPYNAEVFINYGGYEFNPGYGGPGQGAVIQTDAPYDKVDTAPDAAAFNASTLTKIGWDAGNGRGWFFYSLDNHIAVPIKNRTFVIRTASGKYAKLELLSMYKGNPPVVTDLYWPAPYFSFRYFVQEDGSANLKTK